MKTLEESFKKKAASHTAQQDDDDFFGGLLASQLRQLPAHQKIMVKMEINSIIYRCLLSSHAVSAQEIAHHSMTSNSRASQGMTNHGLLLYEGTEEHVPQYPPGYSLIIAPIEKEIILKKFSKFSKYSDVVLNFEQ